ncbi:hypothetical protein JCM10914A_36980 [Paenibacillus sp. JCM 10914]
MQDGLSGEEAFNRALAGLSGVDNFTFQGEAAIRNDPNGPYLQSLAYKGSLMHHTDLTLTSRSKPSMLNQGSKNEPNQENADVTSVSLKREEGRWSILADRDADGMWMRKLNPLELLEYIGESEKTVTRELGAARGTTMLRIELSQEAAAKMTYAGLDEQMKLLAARIDRKGDPLYSDDPLVRERLKSIWSRDEKEMRQMLDDIEAATICHLTIDKHTQLPSRLTMERKLAYVDESGKSRTETLVSDVTFGDL